MRAASFGLPGGCATHAGVEERLRHASVLLRLSERTAQGVRSMIDRRVCMERPLPGDGGCGGGGDTRRRAGHRLGSWRSGRNGLLLRLFDARPAVVDRSARDDRGDCRAGLLLRGCGCSRARRSLRSAPGSCADRSYPHRTGPAGSSRDNLRGPVREAGHALRRRIDCVLGVPAGEGTCDVGTGGTGGTRISSPAPTPPC